MDEGPVGRWYSERRISLTRLIKALALGAGTVAIAAAAPAAAQSYTYPYGTYNPNPYTGTYYGTRPYGTYYGQYGSGQYAYPYGYNYSQNYNPNYNYNPNFNRTSYAEQACSSAVQHRLQTRAGLNDSVERILGAGTPRVSSITSARVMNNGRIRVKGFATSNSYVGTYGSALYGALGYSQQPDIRFRCTVYQNGQVADVDVQKR
jgi:hypothetical protein